MTENPYLLEEEQKVTELMQKDKLDSVAIMYLAKAHVLAEKHPSQALVYATMANAFATIDASKNVASLY